MLRLARVKRIADKHVLLSESVNLLLITSLAHFLIIKLIARSTAREIMKIRKRELLWACSLSLHWNA